MCSGTNVEPTKKRHSSDNVVSTKDDGKKRRSSDNLISTKDADSQMKENKDFMDISGPSGSTSTPFKDRTNSQSFPKTNYEVQVFNFF